ncbi:MAG TPA: hypothetical protein DE036_07215 [Actinobacteria bacterium]|nr:hypothetical protein [Actinomycetota bacterium]
MSLRHAMLGLLTFKPMTGYELKSVFDNSINHFWNAQLSQIYRELGGLEDKGHIVSRVELQHGKPDKKIYSITEEGDSELQRWLESSPKTLSIPMRDELTLRVFFGSRVPAKELIYILQGFIRERQEALAALRYIGECLDGFMCEGTHAQDAFYQKLTLVRGLKFFAADIEWAEESIEQLEQRERQSED